MIHFIDVGKFNKMRIYFGLTRFLSVVAWIISYILLVYLYKKGLSEVWYAHKMFWLVNTVTNLVGLIWALAGNI